MGYNVKVKEFKNERIDSLLRRFKKKVNNADILNIYKSKQEYIKPSTEKRKNKEKSIYFTKKNQKKQDF